jgi:hypothetical protein
MLLPLLGAIGRCLLPGGRAVVAEPGRSIGGTFLDLAAENGFAVARENRSIPWRGRTQEVTLATLTRKEAAGGNV